MVNGVGALVVQFPTLLPYNEGKPAQLHLTTAKLGQLPLQYQEYLPYLLYLLTSAIFAAVVLSLLTCCDWSY